MDKINNCDNCKYYKWYYDYCEKWKCKVDDREVHSCFKGRFDYNNSEMSGHWIDIDTDDCNYNTIKCSCCHKTFTIDAEVVCDIGFIKSDLKFCPNCGVNMESGD